MRTRPCRPEARPRRAYAPAPRPKGNGHEEIQRSVRPALRRNRSTPSGSRSGRPLRIREPACFHPAKKQKPDTALAPGKASPNQNSRRIEMVPTTGIEPVTRPSEGRMISISPRGEEVNYSEKSSFVAKFSDLCSHDRDRTRDAEPATRPSTSFGRSDLRGIHFERPLHARGHAEGRLPGAKETVEGRTVVALDEKLRALQFLRRTMFMGTGS